MSNWSDSFGVLEFVFLCAAIFIVIGGIVVFRQQKAYREYLQRAEKMNQEIHAMNRESHQNARESVAILRAIQALLENRKS